MYAPVSESDPMLLSPSSGKARRTLPSIAVNTQRLEVRAATCNDSVFACLFLSNVVVLGVLAFYKGVPVLREDLNKNGADDHVSQRHIETWSMIGLLCVLGIGLSLAWIKLLMTYAESMIRVALWLNVAMVLVFALSMFTVNLWAALLFLLLAAMNVWYIYAVQNRIGFASANLKAACAGLKQHTAVFVLAFTLVVQQLMWILLWGIACVYTSCFSRTIRIVTGSCNLQVEDIAGADFVSGYPLIPLSFICS
uniref:Choline transporter-like protein n=1 Tax=Hyaloperonospora arabidopsidis (strain Emoy2) TaxID=559515 RepID=M4BM23_HYAAE